MVFSDAANYHPLEFDDSNILKRKIIIMTNIFWSIKTKSVFIT